jgi:hypothetical protein
MDHEIKKEITLASGYTVRLIDERLHVCLRCGRRIFWGETSSGKFIPIDRGLKAAHVCTKVFSKKSRGNMEINFNSMGVR